MVPSFPLPYASTLRYLSQAKIFVVSIWKEFFSRLQKIEQSIASFSRILFLVKLQGNPGNKYLFKFKNRDRGTVLYICW